MTAIRSLDKEGDWEFGKGLASYKRNQNAVAQNVKTRLLEWVGDCFFNNEAGIDWTNRLGKAPESELEQEVRGHIIKTQDVVELVDLNIEFKDRNLKMEFAIKSVFSPSITRETITV